VEQLVARGELALEVRSRPRAQVGVALLDAAVRRGAERAGALDPPRPPVAAAAVSGPRLLPPPPPRHRVAAADVSGHAFLHQRAEPADGLLERRIAVVAVRVEEVDAVGLQA